MRKEATKMEKKKPKSVKDFFLAVLFFAVIGIIAYGIAWLVQTDPVPGDIKVYSGQEEVLTQQRVIREEKKRSDTKEYARYDIEKDAEDFPVVQMSKSIMLEATQDPIGDMFYSVYDASFQELYYREVRFTYPDEPGTYYVVIDTMWGNSDHKFTTQHGFTLIKE